MPLRDQPIKVLKEAEKSSGQFADDILKYVMETSLLGVWAWDLDTDDFFCSKRVMDILGTHEAHMNGNISDMRDRLHADDRERHKNDFQVFLENKEVFTREYRLRRDDGIYIWANIRSHGVWDSEGHLKRLAGSLHDTTQQVELQQSYKKGEDELRLIFDNVPAKIW